MTIDPGLQLQMLAAAALTGLLAGLFSDLLAAFCVLVGAYAPPARMHAYYQRAYPLIGASLTHGKGRPLRRFWRAGMVALLDLLFCISVAIAIEVILYRYNQGVFRVAVPLLLLMTLALWRCTATKLSAYITDGAALVLWLALRYLCALLLWPPRTAAKLFGRLVWRPIKVLCRKWYDLRQERISAALCRRQLIAARSGFGAWQIPTTVEKEEKEGIHEKEREKICKTGADGDHSDPDHRHFPAFGGHHRQPSHRVESQKSRKGTP